MSDDYTGVERRGETNGVQQVILMWPLVLSILGGVVWGVQLNFSVANLIDEVGRLEATTEVAEKRFDQLSEQMLRTSLILTQLEQRMASLESSDRKP